MQLFRKILGIIILTYLAFLGILFLLSLFSIEISNKDFKELYPKLWLIGFPLIILLTLFYTINKKNKKWINIQFYIYTPIVSFFTAVTISFLLMFYEGYWVNYSILYENIENRSITINEQISDAGALGYGEKRIVEIKPIFGTFQKVSEFDTTRMNHEEWKFVNIEGDIKCP